MNAITELERQEVQPQALAAQQQPARQLSVVEYAMQNGASPADVKALVELQIQMDNHKLAMLKQQDERERVQRLEARELAFREAFAAFRGENIIAPRSKHVDRGRAGSFNQAEFEGICRLLSPALSRHGFGFRHDQKFSTKEWPTPENPNAVSGWVWVTCYLEHRGGHTETLVLEGPPDDQSANTPVQNMQCTASYLKRQSLLAITGTATGGEDDENRTRRRGTEPAGDQGADVPASLLDEGREEALKGMAALTDWWRARSAREQKDLQSHYGAMRSAAAKVDKGVHHG
jgi:hypothetical protein